MPTPCTVCRSRNPCMDPQKNRQPRSSNSQFIYVFFVLSRLVTWVCPSRKKNGLRFRKVQFPRLNVLAMSQHLPSYEHVHYGGGFTPSFTDSGNQDAACHTLKTQAFLLILCKGIYWYRVHSSTIWKLLNNSEIKSAWSVAHIARARNSGVPWI